MATFLQRILILFLFIFTTHVYAQNNGSASGKIINNKDKSVVDFASVTIKKASDSTVAGGVSTGSDGAFKIGNLALGRYKLYVGYLGLKTIVKDFELNATNPNINFGTLAMDEDGGVNLNTVTVKGEIPPVIVKKDTLEINAATLKVKENAVVEDLLKKVPGVDVAKDGTVTTQGETIKRVRVDGKDFMGNDPLLATKNLPADMVDKIQIIDDLSEQSKFSGVDDGNREKILNIVTKNGVKNKGWVGNNTAGYGTDDRYDVNLSVNRFNEQQQMSLIGQFNNVNKQNFGGGLGGGGGGGPRSVSLGGGQQTQGITTTNAAGINFGDTYNDGTQFNGSYFFNKSNLFTTNNSLTTNFLGSTTTINKNNQVNNSDRLNHRLNFSIDTKLDSTTSIKIQPNIAYTENTANTLSNYNRTIRDNTKGFQQLNTKSTSPIISNNLLLRKKFLRRGRTLSLNINTNINDNDGDNYNNIKDTVTAAGIITLKNTDQFNDIKSKSVSNTSRLVYTEPLSKTTSLEFNYQNTYTNDESQRFVYDFNNATQAYDVKNLDYSNEFENSTFTNALGLSYNQNEKKYNWNVGLAAQRTNRENNNLTTGNILRQNFTNLTPSAQFRYTFSNSKRLSIRYDGRTNQPSINQIQPVRDNSNTFTVPIGNPDLKPSFANNLRIFYNNFDFASSRTLFLGAFVTQTNNAFANYEYIIDDPTSDDDGKIAKSYRNVDGNFSANAFGNLGLPIIKGNKLNFQINAGLSYAHSTNFTLDREDQAIENITNDFSFSNGYKLVSNLDKLDLIAGISGSVNRSTYTIGNKAQYYTLSPNIDISYLFPGSIRLQTDVTYNKLTGRGAGFNTDYTLVNAYISRKFDRLTFKASVNDLLNQNTGISTTSINNSIVNQNFNVLKRYFMFSLTFSLSNIAGLKMPGQDRGPGEGRRERGGVGDGGGIRRGPEM